MCTRTGASHAAPQVGAERLEGFWGEQSFTNSMHTLWFGVMMLAARVYDHFSDIESERTSLQMKLDDVTRGSRDDPPGS